MHSIVLNAYQKIVSFSSVFYAWSKSKHFDYVLVVLFVVCTTYAFIVVLCLNYFILSLFCCGVLLFFVVVFYCVGCILVCLFSFVANIVYFVCMT